RRRSTWSPGSNGRVSIRRRAGRPGWSRGGRLFEVGSETTDMRALWAGAALLMLVMSGAAVADQASDLSDGLSAYRRQDYVTALRFLQPLADQGVAAAQFNLGLMYANGRGVSKDDTAAAKWFRLAADQGHALAQNNL